MKKLFIRAISALCAAVLALTALPSAAADDLSARLEDHIRAAYSSAKSHGGVGAGSLLADEEYIASVGFAPCDWTAMTLARFACDPTTGGEREYMIDDGGYGAYLDALCGYVERGYAENDGFLHSSKMTEWARPALAIKALGGDPTAVGNYGGKPIDLIADGTYACALKNGPATQGINGLAWALITMNSDVYDVPSNAEYTVEEIVGELLKLQLPDGTDGSRYGGWVLAGFDKKSDADITAMVLQALAPYANSEAEYTYKNTYSGETLTKTVRECADDALDRLGHLMRDSDKYNTAESYAQVVIALCSLGVDPASDARFIKPDGRTMLDCLLGFRTADGGFCHTAGGAWNRTANYQAMYALVSYWRLVNGLRALYDMRPAQSGDVKRAVKAACDAISDLPNKAGDGYVDALAEARDLVRKVPENERRYVYNYGALANAIKDAGGVDIFDPQKRAVIEKFADVDGGAWYTAGVAYCYAKGCMAGVSDSRFGTNDAVTRAMFVTVLAKIDGADVSGYNDISFSDVPSSEWYTKNVEWAFANGFTSGTGRDNNGVPLFTPNAPVTREQLAVFLENYAHTKGADTGDRADLSGFADRGEISAWAADGMAWAVARRLISGTSATALSPKMQASRAQIALIVRNFVDGG